MWILKMGVLQAKSFEFLKSCISKWENGQRTNWPPPKKYTHPPHRATPIPTTLKSKIFLHPPKTQNSKIPTSPPNFPRRERGGAHYGFNCVISLKCHLKGIVNVNLMWQLVTVNVTVSKYNLVSTFTKTLFFICLSLSQHYISL